LKQNDYGIEDQNWLFENIEKRIEVWHHRWLSLGGRLTLARLVLEAVPVYCYSMAYIPIDTLEKIRKKCFKFLQTGKKRRKESH
jgi:hypothetical protein